MKTILPSRNASIPDVDPRDIGHSFQSIQEWVRSENAQSAKGQRAIEDEFNLIGIVKRWTPAITFDTPGDLSVAYSVAEADITRTKESVNFSLDIVTSSFTWTTASGKLRITGFPYTSSSSSNDTNRIWGGVPHSFQGFTKASYTHLGLAMAAGLNYFTVVASGSGQSTVNTQAADWPTGGTIVLRATGLIRLKP